MDWLTIGVIVGSTPAVIYAYAASFACPTNNVPPIIWTLTFAIQRD